MGAQESKKKDIKVNSFVKWQKIYQEYPAILKVEGHAERVEGHLTPANGKAENVGTINYRLIK